MTARYFPVGGETNLQLRTSRESAGRESTSFQTSHTSPAERFGCVQVALGEPSTDLRFREPGSRS
jgi:hypothetical protein